MMNTQTKIISFRKLSSLSKKCRKAGKRVVFTNGTFDLLHTGHVTYLEKARSCGDLLVVGVNTDRSVRSYKGPGRPLNTQRDRVRVLAALACIDYAVLFDEPTPIRLIKALKPQVLAKGADWKIHQIAGAKEVLGWGGKVVRIKLVPGRSTTRLLKLLKFI